MGYQTSLPNNQQENALHIASNATTSLLSLEKNLPLKTIFLAIDQSYVIVFTTTPS